MMTSSQKAKQKRTVVALFLVFILPIILAIYFFSKGEPVGSLTNRGDLITPMKIEPLQITDTNNVLLSQKQLEGKWTLVFIAPSECSDQCTQKLYFLNQLRTAMGKRQDKVRSVALVFANERIDPQLKEIITKQYPTTEIWVSKANILINNTTQQKLQFGTHHIYVVDPQANIMMHYNSDVDPNDILKDLEKLVKD